MDEIKKAVRMAKNVEHRVFNIARKNKKDIASSVLAIMVLLSLIFYGFGPGQVLGATYTFNQTSWTTESADTAVHPTNQSSWAKYSAKDAGITAGATVALTQSSGSVAHTSNADFTGTHALTAVSGTGSSASVKLGGTYYYRDARDFTGIVTGPTNGWYWDATNSGWESNGGNGGVTQSDATHITYYSSGNIPFSTTFSTIATDDYYIWLYVNGAANENFVNVTVPGYAAQSMTLTTPNNWNWQRVGSAKFSITNSTAIAFNNPTGTSYLYAIRGIYLTTDEGTPSPASTGQGGDVYGAYASSGTYTSASIDLGQASDLTTLGFGKTVPSQISQLNGKKYELTSTSGSHTCVLKSNGNVDCYGRNNLGQSADYTGGDAVGVSVGGLNTCVLKSNGNVDCWGDMGGTDYTGGDAVGVSAGGEHTCVLKSNGNVDCWGRGDYGQSADYTGGDAVGVSAGSYHTCALKPNGNVDCWGNNDYGQSADYTGGDAVGVSVGGYNTCVLKSNGNVDCYGDNSSGQTADYTGGDAVEVSGSEYNTCVLKSNGNVDCWGSIMGTDYTGGDAVGVSVGGSAYCALKSNGNVDCWGSNDYGQSADYTGGDAKLPYDLKFQLAANNDNATWNYVGPDGTANTYYMSTGETISSTLDGNRYIRYKLYLGTLDTAYTPQLDDVTINYNYYPTSTLTSSTYDTGDATNIMSKIEWTGSTTTTAVIKFQIRTSANGSSWTDFLGPDGTTGTYFENSAGTEAMPSAFTSGNNDRYFQYKAYLTSTGIATPTLTGVTVTYVVNAPPAFDSTYGTNGVSVSQISNSSDVNWGKVQIQYAVKDTDTTTGTNSANYVTPTFEYNIGGGWIAVNSANITWADAPSGGGFSTYGGNTTNKVLAGSYLTYTAYWDAKTQISGNYSATAQIRVTANDNEGANNTATATGANFIMDTTSPTVTTLTLNSQNDSVTLNLTDDSNIEYMMSNNSDFSADGANSISGSWRAVGGSSTSSVLAWTFTGSPSHEKIYFQVRDAYGNAVNTSDTAPSTPQSLVLFDVSNSLTGSYRELTSWEMYTASTSAAFGYYKLYRSTDGVNYSLLATLSDADNNSHTDTSVASTSTYYYKVAVMDSDGDLGDYSSAQNDQPDGQGGSDFTAPTISSVAVAETQATWAKITWTTDEMADSKVEYSTAAAGDYSSNASSTAYVTSHSVTVTGLTPATNYVFRIKSKDILANEGSDAGSSFTTASGPVISDVVTSYISDVGAEITWNTNNDSNSYVIYSTNTGHLTSGQGASTAGSGTAVGGSGPLYYHKVALSNLLPRTTYYYYVKSIDASSNEVTDKNSSSYYSFTTTYDTKAPVISNISTPVKTANSMVIFWNTDELANSQVDFGVASGEYTNSGTLDSALTTGHAFTLSNLTAESTYHYRIRSADTQGNIGYSDDQTATTTTARDVQIQYVGGGGSVAPAIVDNTGPSISNIKTSSINAFDASISFDTNEVSTGYVLYGKDKTYGNVAASPDLKTGHSVKLPGLVLGTEYHYKVRTQDKSGNFSDSEDKTFTTKFATESLENLVTLENAESFQQELEGIIESIMPSLSAPFIGKVEVSDVTENSAVVKWTTNIKTYGSAAYVSDSDYDAKNDNPYKSEISDTQEKTKTHQVNLTNLSPSMKYHLQAKSYAIPGVVGKSKDIEFTTKSSKISPEVTRVGNTQIEIRWTTSDETSSFVEYKNMSTKQIGQKGDNAMAKVHSVNLENLSPATTYEIKAYGYDANNNIVEGNTMTVRTKQDVTAPEISSIKIDNALVPGRTDRLQTIVFWKTNEPANSVAYYEEGISNNENLANKVGEENAFSTEHAVIIANFKPSTVYRIKVSSEDEAGNKTDSSVRAILTPRSAESIVDVIFKNFQESFGFLKKLQR